jgi:hypothetical protein
MSQTTSEFIEHHGVKGMKWGIRNDKGHQGERAKTKKIARLDKKFAKNAHSPRNTINIYNRGADLTNKNDIDRINNKPEYKDKDFSRDTPLRQKYYKEHQDALINNLERAAREMGTNASGTQRYGILETSGGWDVYLKDVKHANDVVMSFKINYDENGYITSIVAVDPVAHSVTEFIEHYGVKGMKWGIRNKKGKRTTSSDHKSTKSYRNRKPSELTNRQIRLTNERIQLEQNYRRLNPSKVAIGASAVKGIMGALGTAASFYALTQSPAGKAAIALGKKAMKA